MSIIICSKPFCKNTSVEYILQGFQNHFQENFLSVPILEFLAPLEGFSKGLAANQQVNYYRGEK
jgi:hypothetical protein